MSQLNLGDAAIPFSLTGVDDQQHSLESHNDKNAVAMVFSCNHCPFVLAWEDRMMQIQNDYKDKGVQFLVINANDAQKHPTDSFEKMKERQQEQNFNFPYLRDESQEVAKAYGAERTPEIYLFDKDRKLSYHGAIDDNYEDPSAVSANYLRDALDAVLSGQTPATPKTDAVGCTIKWK